MKKIIILIMFLFISAITAAEDTPLEELLSAKSIRCCWGKGATANWVKGKPEIKIEQWNPQKEDSCVIFDAIDIKSGKARIIASSATDVSAFATAEGVTFIENTSSGNLSIVTVFPEKEKGSDKFIAVMSRHMNMPQTPFPQQYYGTAEILE